MIKLKHNSRQFSFWWGPTFFLEIVAFGGYLAVVYEADEPLAKLQIWVGKKPGKYNSISRRLVWPRLPTMMESPPKEPAASVLDGFSSAQLGDE
jgi:hypothetical protein